MSGELFDRLRTRARDFEFAQWIRLWLREKIQSDHRGGDALQRLDDGLDVHHSGSLGFAPQDIDAAGASPEGEEELRVHFMGLQGASSPLPAYLVDPLQRSDERWNPLREFYRLFEGRVYRVLGAGLIERSPVLRAELGLGCGGWRGDCSNPAPLPVTPCEANANRGLLPHLDASTRRSR